ncbi:hypothetical protein [Spirosoma harenae]
MRKVILPTVWLMTASSIVLAQPKNDTGGGHSSGLGTIVWVVGLVVVVAAIYFFSTRSKKS